MSRVVVEASPIAIDLAERERRFIADGLREWQGSAGWTPLRIEALGLSNWDEFDALHYITSIANLRSIMTHGLLSHNQAAKISHESVAEESVQAIGKSQSQVDCGSTTMSNIYFDARHAMMYCRLPLRETLAVVRVNPVVLDVPGAVITDLNAAIIECGGGRTRQLRRHPHAATGRCQC